MDPFTNHAQIPLRRALPAGNYKLRIHDMNPQPSKKNPTTCILLAPQLKAVDPKFNVYPPVYDSYLPICVSDPSKGPEWEAMQLIGIGQFLRALGSAGFPVDYAALSNKTPQELLHYAITYIKANAVGKEIWAKVGADQDGRARIMEYFDHDPAATAAGPGVPGTAPTIPGMPAGMPGAPGAPVMA